MYAAVLGCGSSAEKRLKRHFKISKKGYMDVEQLRIAVLDVVPFGTEEQEIYGFLDDAGVGEDKFSSYHRLNSSPFNNPTSIICVVHYDHLSSPF